MNVAERTGTIPVHSGKICGNGTLAKLLHPIGAHSSESFGGKSSAEDCLAAVNHPVDELMENTEDTMMWCERRTTCRDAAAAALSENLPRGS